jgi:hypothetical protein
MPTPRGRGREADAGEVGHAGRQARGGAGRRRTGLATLAGGERPASARQKYLNRISTTQKGLTSAGIPTELNDKTAGVPTGFQQHKKD